ncbi:hypothetical protein ACAW74_25815 [Fibrella sp. WM1]|uniref:hypothetical protein n=1 Tax=Fibrella musci TaxID=3242485 RepID=UPI003522516C
MAKQQTPPPAPAATPETAPATTGTVSQPSKTGTFQVNHVDGGSAHLGSLQAVDGRPTDLLGAMSLNSADDGFFVSGSSYTVTVTKNAPNQMV